MDSNKKQLRLDGNIQKRKTIGACPAKQKRLHHSDHVGSRIHRQPHHYPATLPRHDRASIPPTPRRYPAATCHYPASRGVLAHTCPAPYPAPTLSRSRHHPANTPPRSCRHPTTIPPLSRHYSTTTPPLSSPYPAPNTAPMTTIFRAYPDNTPTNIPPRSHHYPTTTSPLSRHYQCPTHPYHVLFPTIPLSDPLRTPAQIPQLPCHYLAHIPTLLPPSCRYNPASIPTICARTPQLQSPLNLCLERMKPRGFRKGLTACAASPRVQHFQTKSHLIARSPTRGRRA